MNNFEQIQQYRKLLIRAYSAKNKKVIPRSILKFPKSSHHIFPDNITHYMESRIKNQKFQELSNFEKAKILGQYLCLNKHISYKTAEKLRQDIAFINNNRIQNLKNKLHSLCTNNQWKNMGQTDVIINIFSTPLTTYESETLKFRTKSSIGLYKKHDLQNIININYRHTDSDFEKA